MSEQEKNEILEDELNLEELDAVSGGIGSYGPGGCTKVYYKEKCAATVEEWSLCKKNDWCAIWDKDYTSV